MTKFNLQTALKKVQAIPSNEILGVAILAPSGGGKSSLAGSFGVKTLYLYTKGETHGPSNAASIAEKTGGEIVPYRIDDVESADMAFDNLLDLLDDIEGLKEAGIKAVVIDSATELEKIIKATDRWRGLCMTPKGGHNNFAETGATMKMLDPILHRLRSLQAVEGIHFAMTITLDVKEISDNGEIQESRPRLDTYGVAESLIQQFGDIVAVGRMTNGDDVAHRIQFLAGMSRVSKDQTGMVRKSTNFAPRLVGKVLEDLPKSMKADLRELIKFKKGE